MSVTSSAHEHIEGLDVSSNETGVAIFLAHPDSAERSRRNRPIAQERLLATVSPILFSIILLTLWVLITLPGGISKVMLPAPLDVWSSLVMGLQSGLFAGSALTTIQESVVGFLLALIIVLPLGIGIAKSRLLAVTVQPYLAAGQAIPAMVIAPLLFFWLGYGIVPNIVLCTLVVLFPMVITTAFGFQSIDRSIVEAARVEGAGFWPLLWRIEYPMALPALLTAVRTGLTLSIVGALVGEFVSGGDSGLGGLILQAKSQFDLPLMFAALVILGILATLYYVFSGVLMRIADRVY